MREKLADLTVGVRCFLQRVMGRDSATIWANESAAGRRQGSAEPRRLNLFRRIRKLALAGRRQRALCCRSNKLRFNGEYWQLSEEMIADVAKERLAEIAEDQGRPKS